MLLKKFVLFKFLNIPLLLIYSILITITIYFNGGSNNNIGKILIYISISLLPFVFFPVSFFAIHYWYYRDVNVKTKLIVCAFALIFAILFIASFWIDKTSEYLNEKKIFSFGIGMLFNLSSIFYAFDVVKTNK